MWWYFRYIHQIQKYFKPNPTMRHCTEGPHQTPKQDKGKTGGWEEQVLFQVTENPKTHDNSLFLDFYFLPSVNLSGLG